MGLLADSDKSSRRSSVKTIPMAEWQRIVQACSHVTPILAKLVQDFWGIPVQLKFFSASDQNLYFWRLDDFHVSQVAVDAASQKVIQLRVSDKVCSALLSQVLGPRPLEHEKFRFNRITDFEAMLLTQFSKELFSGFLKNMIRKPSQTSRKSPLIHLIWSMKLDLEDTPETSQPTGKIVVSLPLDSLELESLVSGQSPVRLPETHLDHAHVEAMVGVGQTKIRLEDLKNLEVEDMLVLSESHVGRMFLLEPETRRQIPFGVTIRKRHKIEIPYTQEIEMMESQQKNAVVDNLWENLMIDVTAEFFPTKVPLGHLKQMSEGLVVEIGDLIHNQVRIHVEGKTVALGELVVVGDKFGVKVVQLEDGQGVHPTSQTSPYPLGEPAHAASSGQAQDYGYGQGEQGGGEEYYQPPAQTEPQEMNDLDQYLNNDFDNESFNDDEGW